MSFQFAAGSAEHGSEKEGLPLVLLMLLLLRKYRILSSSNSGLYGKAAIRKVARLILRIACARSPHLRYIAGRNERWVPYMKVLLPQRLFDYALRRGFGLLADG